MRRAVILVAALAASKVWTQDRMYRSIMQDALIAAYRDRAAATCQKELARTTRPAPNLWTSSSPAEVTIGNASTDVAVWDFENPLWDVRFRHPHVKLTAADAKSYCAFDVAAGLATIGG